MPSITVQGTPHRYDLTAKTPCPWVLVFVHGWLLSRSYWQPLIDQLATDFCCLSYDLRGFGASGVNPKATPEDYAPQAYARDLGALLEALEIPAAWLVGHSLGGEVALWAATMWPESVKGVTCLGVGGGIYLKEEFERFRDLGQQLLQWRQAWLGYVPGIDYVFARASVQQPLASPWGRRRLLDFLGADRSAALGSLFGLTAEQEVHRLPRLVASLSQPAYFIAGQQDPIMEPQYVRHLASFHPLFQEGCGCNFLELADCGHLAMLEQTEGVAEHLRRWVLAHQAGAIGLGTALSDPDRQPSERHHSATYYSD